MRFFLLLLLISSPAFARLNFIEAHLLRLSHSRTPGEWLVPGGTAPTQGNVGMTVFASGHKDVMSVYDDLKSEDQNKITQRLSKSFGHPYDLSARVGFMFHFGDFTQQINTNGGAVLSVTDPVFPELKGMLFHDYSAITSYRIRHENLILVPKLSYGFRRFIREQFTVGDIVQKNVDVKFNEVPYVFFAEAGLKAKYLTKWGSAEARLNAIPLRNDVEGYWDTYIGYRTPDFLEAKESLLEAYAGYSPLYGGEYDVMRTFRTGVRSQWNFVSGEVFTLDKFYPGALVALDITYLRLAFHTLERAYDDHGNQRSRQYGIEITGRF